MKDFEVPPVQELLRKMICQKQGLPYRPMSYDELVMDWSVKSLTLVDRHGDTIIPGYSVLLEAVKILHKSTDLDDKFKVNALLKAAQIERQKYAVNPPKEQAPAPATVRPEETTSDSETETAGNFQVQTFELPEEEEED